MKRLGIPTVFLLLVCRAFCQYPVIPYEHIFNQPGLNDHFVTCILQDNKGFIWFGGQNGIYRFDGYKNTYIKDAPGCSDCPPLFNVCDMVQDDRGMLWIITFDGIILFSPETGRFRMVRRFNNTFSEKDYGKMLDLCKDELGNIWASNDLGVLRFSYKKDNQVKFVPVKYEKYTLQTDRFHLSRDTNSGQNKVQKIFEDQEGNIWIGCYDGLSIMRKGDTSFHNLELKIDRRSNFPIYFYDMLQEKEDTFWITSIDNYIMTNVKKALHGSIPDGSALDFAIFDTEQSRTVQLIFKTRKSQIFYGNDLDLFQFIGRVGKNHLKFQSLYKPMLDRADYITTKDPWCMLEDRSGMLWTGHRVFGILKFNLDRSQFTSYKELVSNTFTSTDITSLCFDGKGDLWIGAWGSGLYRLQMKTNQITRFDLGFQGNRINCLVEISPGILWLGVNEGLLEFNTQTGRVSNPFQERNIPEILRRDYSITGMLKVQNRLFISTLHGLFVYDFATAQLLLYLSNGGSSRQTADMDYPDDYIASTVLLKNGDVLFISEHHGIQKILYDPEKVCLSAICLVEDSVLRHKNIYPARCMLFQDSRDSLWMVEKTGLHRIDLEKGEIFHSRLIKDIEFPHAESIIEDDHGNLWIGTRFGLSRFNINTGQVKNFTKEDGLPICIHQLNTVTKDMEDRLYFGGFGGFYSFHPDSVKTNTYIPPVAITDFRLFNKSVKIDTVKNSILAKNIAYTSLIELQHNQNDIAFEFAALDYTLPSRNQYAYRLEGFQNDWVKTDAGNRVATYTNLDPGNYIFRVKGSNSDGVWNEEGTSLTIIIHKPWYGTNLSWIVYVLVFLGAVSGYIRWRLWQLRMEKLKLENQVQERTQQIEEQKDMLEQQNKQITEQEQMKSRFFTNVSHEFRTPLSMIQSPVEELLDDPRRNEKERRKLNLVQRNARRLLNLVNQLLDISKIDGSKMKQELVNADVTEHLRAITGAFASLAETKSIHYQCCFPSEKIISWFDTDKLEKIAGNILSNAFKFTPEGGEIVFTALYKYGDDHRIERILEFSVKDTGTGIPAGSLEKIFDRFYQVEMSTRTEGGGTGIGLSLARDLVHLLHGEISVESEPGKGSTFTVSIPLGTGHLKESEYIFLKEVPEFAGILAELHENSEEVTTDQEEISKDEKPVILIVEDNRDIRLQLADNLNREYRILEAIDGVAGLKKATEMIPDLIITDLMMPRMDGMELCEKLKNDERTSHIPVVMLTAKVTLEDKVTGYLTGADDYIPKPFNMVELKARVANLIEQRKKLRERFSREVTLQPRDISITPLDEQFLNKAIEAVEKHMDDENYDLTRLRDDMNMTRSTLFRKLHALTNQSPNEFIRTIRLKRAASLLTQHFGNVTQVSLEVGFNNLSYFNRSFKKLFGISPMEYVKKQGVEEGTESLI